MVLCRGGGPEKRGAASPSVKKVMPSRFIYFTILDGQKVVRSPGSGPGSGSAHKSTQHRSHKVPDPRAELRPR
jgi:hypothetical protein